MGEVVIFSSNFIKLFRNGKEVFIQTLSLGMPPDELQRILSEHPEIQITSFIAIRNALSVVSETPVKIGEMKERIAVRFADNDMKAFVILNIPKDEAESIDRNQLLSDINRVLLEKNVVYGIKSDFLPETIQPGQEILVAEGSPPVNGSDAVIKLFQIREAAPEIREDGKADFYELQLINKVEANGWLGEKSDPTEGIPGQTVKGAAIKAQSGKNLNLLYDKNSVYEVKEEGKTILKAMFAGAVNIIDGKISVTSHIDINGDVDVSTGNLNFDGCITIKGTVQEGFCVQATGDIEILSDFGISGAKEIISTNGSVYIKGGISGQNKTQIKAAKDVFTKFADFAAIECEGSLHFGYYCMNSTVKACEVVMDSSNGQIFGGNVIAEARVICPIIGSEMEKRTVITVLGFDRKRFQDKLHETEQAIADIKAMQKTLADKIKQAPPTTDKMELVEMSERLRKSRTDLKDLENQKKNLINYLRTKGEGEITASKVIYGNCLLQIKDISFEVKSEVKATSYYVIDGELKTS